VRLPWCGPDSPCVLQESIFSTLTRKVFTSAGKKSPSGSDSSKFWKPAPAKGAPTGDLKQVRGAQFPPLQQPCDSDSAFG
jgi:hypothetical protein